MDWNYIIKTVIVSNKIMLDILNYYIKQAHKNLRKPSQTQNIAE